MQQNKFKLDNAAIIYPAAKSSKWTAMFKISVTLKEIIDIDILKKALIKALKRMPPFSCTIKQGFFWHYLKKIEGIPPILKDIDKPMKSLNYKENNGFLFRVRYADNILSMEFFHSLTDGTGGMTFLLTVVKEYLFIKYNEKIKTDKYLLDCNIPFDEKEYQDDYYTFAKKTKQKLNDCKCYYPKTKVLNDNDIDILSIKLNTDELKLTTKKYNSTIGEFLTAALIYSIYLRQIEENTTLPIKVAVPINLRYFYPSVTLANFTTFATPGIIDFNKKYSFEDIVKLTKDFLRENTKEEILNSQFSKTVRIQNNFFVHYIPMFIKKHIMKAIYLNSNTQFSSTFSNLGNITLPDNMVKYIDSINFVLGQASIAKVIGTCISYNNKTTINFSKTIIENKIENHFLNILKKERLIKDNMLK